MNKGNIIVTINNAKDIEKVGVDTKYVNLSIDNIDMAVIDYFLLNGKDYLYSDNINNINGFIYVNYNTFFNSEKVIDNIIDSMPTNLEIIEKIKYLYVSLGKVLSKDINTIEDKNEVVSFSNISTINNIWGSISKRKTSDIAISKILLYLCSRIGIKSELINSSFNNNIGNKIYIDDNNYIIVNLYNDLPYIQGGFILKHFDKYGNDKKIDKKIGYIDNEYTDYYLSNALSNINYLDSNVLNTVLSLTEKIINIDSIGPLELSIVYKNIFDEYLPNYDVRINNFYVNDNGKEHFIVINYGEEYYSYNYNKHAFIKVKYEDIYKNLEEHLIGLYYDEDFIISKKDVVL
mgnify:CR=1 FL=1